MSQQRSFLRLPLAGPLIICLLTGISVFLWRWCLKSDSSEPVSRHTVDTSADEALNYWTADKMRKARPAPLPHVDPPANEKQPPRKPRSDKSS